MKKATKILLSTTIVCIITSASLICTGKGNGGFTNFVNANIIKNDCVISVPTESFKEIDINMPLGPVFIETGLNYAIGIEYSKKIDKVDWQIVDGKLKIDIKNNKASQNIGIDDRVDCPKVTISIPKDKQFNKIFVKTGFGGIVIKKLSAKEVELDSKMGYIKLSNVNIGNLTVKNSRGDMSVTGDITESIDIKNSIGKTKLNLKQSAGYYNHILKCSMGKIKVDGLTCKVSSRKQIINNNKTGKPLKIDSDMGDVKINFES